jgi:uncharacterized protein
MTLASSLRLVVPLFAALALAAPLPASAESAPVCQGRDLSQDPSIKPDLAAHADDYINGEGLLWKIEKPGLAPSYLYGTIHSTTPAAIALASEAAAYVDGASIVATELGALGPAQKGDLGAGMLKLALSPDSDTIAGAMSAEEAAGVEAFLSEHGIPREMAHHLKLWFLAVFASLPGCEAEGQKKGLREVDEMLAQIGQAHNLPVVGLETVDEQLQAMAATPNALAATMLIATARAPSLNDDGYVTLLSLYARKRPSAAIAILDALPELTPQERAAEAEFTRLLLIGRNGTMMTRASPLLEKGGAFVAVGALHLTGKDGLIERVRAAGYQVTKVW